MSRPTPLTVTYTCNATDVLAGGPDNPRPRTGTGLDGLRLPGLAHFEVSHRQIGDRLAVAVRDDDIDADRVDAGAERRLLLRRGNGEGDRDHDGGRQQE